MNDNDLLIGVHSRHLAPSGSELAAAIGISECTHVDLNEPVYELLNALDPLVASGLSLRQALSAHDGWAQMISDRIIGAEVSRLVIACREAMRLDDPGARYIAASEAIGDATGIVLVTGLANQADAAFIRSMGGQIWSVEHAGMMGMPANPVLPLSWVDHFLPTAALCGAGAYA